MPFVPAASPLDRLSSPAPPGRFLSNGSYVVLITSAGTGFSTAGGCDLNVWSGDRIDDPHGFFFHVQDVERRAAWSAGDQPLRHPWERYLCRWSPGSFEISRMDDGIATRMEVCVPSGDPIELRRITLTNYGEGRRRIDLTSYVEVLLGSRASHAAHPAFSKLFIRTEPLTESPILIATRRPQREGESFPCMFHAMLGGDALEWETDRERFLGRRRSPSTARALQPGSRLSGTTGDVLDPILCLRRAISLAPRQSVTSTFILGCAEDRGAALDMIARLTAEGTEADPFDSARRREAESLRTMGIAEPEAEYAQDIASAMFYGHPALRCAPAVIERARGSYEDLERLGLSRRRPFAVLHAERPAGREIISALLRIHRYWRALTLEIDLLILCDDPGRVRAEAGPHIDDLVRLADPAGVSAATRDWLDAAARLVVLDRLPDLGEAPSAGSAP